MAQFRMVKEGMEQIAQTQRLFAELAVALNTVGPVTDDPLTFNWLWTFGDLTPATFTGSTPIALDTLTTLGPFQDPAQEEIFYKFAGVLWTNTGATTETITGFQVTAAGNTLLLGVLILDDPIVVPPAEVITLDLLIGIGQSHQDSAVEDLEGA